MFLIDLYGGWQDQNQLAQLGLGLVRGSSSFQHQRLVLQRQRHGHILFLELACLLKRQGKAEFRLF